MKQVSDSRGIFSHRERQAKPAETKAAAKLRLIKEEEQAVNMANVEEIKKNQESLARSQKATVNIKIKAVKQLFNSQMNSIRSNTNTTTTPAPFPCRMAKCKKSFVTEEARNGHESSHALQERSRALNKAMANRNAPLEQPKKEFACNKCKKKFAADASRQQHQQTCQGKSTDALQQRSGALNKASQSTLQTPKKTFECDKCNKKFATDASRQQHQHTCKR